MEWRTNLGEFTIGSAVFTAEDIGYTDIGDRQINSRDKKGLLQIRSNTLNCNQQHIYKVQDKLHLILHHRLVSGIS